MKNTIIRIQQEVERVLLGREDWMFYALIVGAAIQPTQEFPPHSWVQYFAYIGVLGILFSPQFFFVMKKNHLRETLHSSYFYGLWFLSFAVYPLLLAIFVQEYQPLDSLLAYREEYLYIVGSLFFSLALLLEFHRFFQKKIKEIRWFQTFSLGKAIFLVMVGIAVFITFYAFNNPETKFGQRVGDLHNGFPQSLGNIPQFLSIGIQYLFLYSLGYLFYYINHKLLIGKLLKQKGIVHYVMGVFASIVVLYPVFAQLIMWLPLHREYQILAPSENMIPFDFVNGAVSFVIMLLTLPVILVFQWFQQNNQILGLEKQQVQTELDLLKQQINPHFFFNTLNNLYSLSQKKSEQTPEVILQLSELMRYVIYRGKEQEVKIKEEINYLHDYSSLQQIRLHKKLDYKFEVEIEDEDLPIPPLLLVVLVENAYKHGIEPAEHPAFLHMRLVNRNGEIAFTCTNSYEDNAVPQGGLGIENLKRRLDLLFGTNYTLTLEAEDAIFRVHLSWKT